MENKRDPGSFRDDRGHIYLIDGKIYRTINRSAIEQYKDLIQNKIISKSINNNYLVNTTEVSNEIPNSNFKDPIYKIVQHEKIPFISYPYEWSFSQLKEAALHHLKFNIFLLKNNFILRDASAYNIQFIGTRPIFIDLLSISKYEENELWYGYRQFCMQFLNPLILRSKIGITHNEIYKGYVEGIPSSDISKMLSFKKFTSFNLFSHVYLHAKSEKIDKIKETNLTSNKRKLSRRAYLAILEQLYKWIDGMKPLNFQKSIWGEYSNDNTYLDSERIIKENIVSDFCKKNKPNRVIDLGCNTGNYSDIALESGAGYVIGFDFDNDALEIAFKKFRNLNKNILTLYMDASNPSSSIGWNEIERQSFSKRSKVDAVIALAFEHHMIIGKNIFIDEFIDWLLSISDDGLVEFVKKDDPTIIEMLKYREDVFDSYSEENFINTLKKKAHIINITEIKPSGRKIIEYKKI